MTDPLHQRDEIHAALRQVFDASEGYLRSLSERPVYDLSSEPRLRELGGLLPETGLGTEEAVRRLLDVGTATATGSAGPRFYHFVIGGATPAAVAADWITSMLDQNAAMRASSMLAHEVETIAIAWLRELFDLPEGWGGALTASATLANFTGLGSATHWWGEQHGVDVAEVGLSGLPRMPVVSSGYVHPSARKALQMLGHGRQAVEVFSRDGVGRVDLAALDRRLAEVGGPAVVLATVGEPNAGDADPVEDVADIAERHGAWLHVDGAFGIFARLSPETAHLAAGVERADSIAADAHKWLNVPYESGFLLMPEPERLGRAFGMPGAAYLPGPDDPRSGYMLFGPESSRRARALPIWATIAAYGRDGHREMVERHCSLARHLAGLVESAPDLELLAEVRLNVVCFRFAPPGVGDGRLDGINRELGERLLDDGRVFAGTTVYDGRVGLRPAISNWRTTAADLDLFVDVVRELGARVAAE